MGDELRGKETDPGLRPEPTKVYKEHSGDVEAPAP